MGGRAPPRADHRPRLRLDHVGIGARDRVRRRARSPALPGKHPGRSGTRPGGLFRRRRRRRLAGAVQRSSRRDRGAGYPARRRRNHPRRPRAGACRRGPCAAPARSWPRPACATRQASPCRRSTAPGSPSYARLSTASWKRFPSLRSPRGCDCGSIVRSPSPARARWRRGRWPPARWRAATGSSCSAPSGRDPVVVRGLQSRGEPYSTLGPVSRVAINLRGVSRDAVRRGDALVTPDAWPSTDTLDVRRTTGGALTEAPAQLVVHVGTAAVPARLRPFDDDHARLTLDRQLPLVLGDRVVLRYPGSGRVLGGAQVLDAEPPVLRRRGDSARRAAALAGMDARRRRARRGRSPGCGAGIPPAPTRAAGGR